jgi:N-acetylmuramic acid 6-phosphate etherase
MQDRGHLLTEQRNAESRLIDQATISEGFDIIHGQDAAMLAAVAAAKDAICDAATLVTSALRAGGRLFYVGAGTSGRLGMLDAAECPPTFMTDPQMIQGIIAGGPEAMIRSVEGAEDDPRAGAAAIDERKVTNRDVVFGIAAGGTTPFVHGALRQARSRGASTVFFACVSEADVPDDADVSIRVLTGPEIITGSTRMKAGTATKLVLNTISTLAMIQLGKTYENLMIDLNTRACAKLTDRATRIITMLTDLPREDALNLLNRADGRVKPALVMHATGGDLNAAEAMLANANGKVRTVLDARA